MSGRIMKGWFLKMLSPTRAVRNSPPIMSGRYTTTPSDGASTVQFENWVRASRHSCSAEAMGALARESAAGCR